MEAIPSRSHGWKVAGSRKCPLIEVVTGEKVGRERKCVVEVAVESGFIG